MCLIPFAQKIDTLIEPLRHIANQYGAPTFDLAARLYLAKAFFSSGILRFNDWKNGNFDNQIFLFTDEHPVPGLNPEFAAYSTTMAELILPVLLVLGLFGRVGAAGILIMTAIIEFTYFSHVNHLIWAILATTIFIKGSGRFSADHILLKILRKKDHANTQ